MKFGIRPTKIFLFDGETERELSSNLWKEKQLEGLAISSSGIDTSWNIHLISTFEHNCHIIHENYDYRSGSFDGLTFSNYGIVLGITEVVPGIEASKYTQFIQYALPNTLILTAITVPISVVLALLIAIGINSIKFMKKFLQTVFFLPYVTNVIAVGMVFSLMFTTGGLINKLFNLTTNWV